MRELDYYAVLGVEPGADASAIRAAYRRAARQHHPDRGGSADAFHRVQEAWEVLGSEESRQDYDRRRGGAAESAPSPEPTEEGAGFTYTRSGAARTSSRAGSGSRERRRPRRTAQPDQPPVYVPPLESPEPLSLALTSQRVHGHFAPHGLFGRSKTARRHQRTVEILEKHVLSALPAARLFNDVRLTVPPAAKSSRRRAKSPTVDHVLLCGQTLVLVSALEVPAAAASWDGRALRAAGRVVPLPNLAAAATQLRISLAQRLTSAHQTSFSLETDYQHLLLAADGDVFHPVVEAQGAGRHGPVPLAAGRAIGHLVNVLSDSPQAHVVDRRVMAALREHLAAPETP